MGLFVFGDPHLLALSIYCLATILFMGVIMDTLEEDEAMPAFVLLIASLLWPIEAVLMIWRIVTGQDNDNEPDN